MDFYRVLGTVLREHREQQGKSLFWVAKQTGISVSGYRRIECAIDRAPMDKVERVCNTLGVTLKAVLVEVTERM